MRYSKKTENVLCLETKSKVFFQEKIHVNLINNEELKAEVTEKLVNIDSPKGIATRRIKLPLEKSMIECKTILKSAHEAI